MNTETLLVEAWLKAGITNSQELGCPEDSALSDLLARQLPEQEARRVAAHLVSCAGCRKTVARLTASRSVPVPAGATLRELLAAGDVTEAWRGWLRGLVSTLPAEEDDWEEAVPAGFKAGSYARIDPAGRLVVDLLPAEPLAPNARMRIALAGDGCRLELCDVTARPDRIYAVVDLSAFQPVPGIVSLDTLAVERAPVLESTTLLRDLAALQDQALFGADFWDRFRPIAALGSGLAAQLAHEIVTADTEQMTQAPRRRGGQASAAPPADKTPTGRVQYALKAIEDYAALWKECNGKELEGAAECIAQLRAALSPLQPSGVETPVTVKAAPVAVTSGAPGR